jgi:hypothetical protein
MVLLNIVFQKELELLYGKGTIVEINSFKYCTTTKDFSLDCTLKVSDIEAYGDVQLDGLRYLIDESWKYTGMGKNKITLISSVDIL